MASELARAHVKLGQMFFCTGDWAEALHGWKFRRGMLEAIQADASVFLDNAAEWFAEWPTLSVAKLTRAGGHLPELASSPWLAHLRGLDLSDNGIDSGGLAYLTASRFICLLQALDLSGNPIGPRGASVYIRAQQAVEGLTRAAALQCVQQRVRVNAVSPSAVTTDMLNAPAALHPIGRMGRPEDVARALRLRVSNASCPGETTASMFVPGAQSNGCENSVGSPVGYRTLYPLHVRYRGTQMQYALRYLAGHRHVGLVTIDIGANDVFLCQETTADGCVSPAEFDAVLQQIGANLTVIYTLIRDVARYHGVLVAVTYYSLSYSDPAEVAGTQALDAVIASVTEKFGGQVADGFAAFQGPSAAFGGSPCAA